MNNSQKTWMTLTALILIVGIPTWVIANKISKSDSDGYTNPVDKARYQVWKTKIDKARTEGRRLMIHEWSESVDVEKSLSRQDSDMILYIKCGNNSRVVHDHSPITWARFSDRLIIYRKSNVDMINETNTDANTEVIYAAGNRNGAADDCIISRNSINGHKYDN